MVMIGVELIVTILMFCIGFGKIKHDNHKTKNSGEQYLKELENTDASLEYDLWIQAVAYKKFDDGTKVNPHIKYQQEIWWAINEQLKKRGLRLTPDGRARLMYFGGVFDENGLCPKNPYYKSK